MFVGYSAKMRILYSSTRLICSGVARLKPLPTSKLLHGSAALQSVDLDISGIYPPITTPFDQDENIDWLALKSNMNRWKDIPFRGYVVQGSNGEYAYMTHDERLNLVSHVKKNMADDKLLIVGSGCESTRATIEMTNNMADSGADAALVVTPCFYKSGMTSEAMYAHYKQVADHSNIPIILYSVPSNTGIDLDAEVI